VPRHDILLKNGTLIDPGNKLNGSFDLAISKSKISAVSSSIPEKDARTVVDASGMVITPGLIDLHAHCYGYFASIYPDELCIPFGTTTMLDAGGSGWKTFNHMNETVISKSITRVFSLLNIVGSGMIQDKEQVVSDMDPFATADKINERKDVIVGVKVAHFEAESWEAVDRGRKAAEISNTFLMVDQNPISGRTMEDLLKSHMVKGDILTHVYAWGKPIIDENGKVAKYFFEARDSGIIFDLGHGAGSFSFAMAEPSINQGFPPDTISTDHHRSSMLTNHSNMTNCMTKMMVLGLTLPEVIEKSTLAPSLILGHPELGHIGEGSEADVAVLKVKDGDFGLIDNGLTGNRVLKSKQLIENQMTIKAGDIVWDKEGSALDSYKNTPKPDLKSIYHQR
jgi:dihydroorotase